MPHASHHSSALMPTATSIASAHRAQRRERDAFTKATGVHFSRDGRLLISSFGGIARRSHANPDNWGSSLVRDASV
jgi:hypothetical protein